MQRRRFGALGVAALLALTGCTGDDGPGPSVAPAPSQDASSQPAPPPPSDPTPSEQAPSSTPADPEPSEGGVAEEVEAETGVRPPVVHPAMFADGAPKSFPEELAGFTLHDPRSLILSAHAEYYPADDANLDGFDLHVLVDERRFRVLKDSSDITAEQHGLCGFRKNGLPHCVAFTEDGSVELVYFGDEGSMSFEELDGHLAEALDYFGGL